MIEVAQYVLSDFFRFVGVVLIIAIVFDGLASVIVAIRGGRPNSIIARLFGSAEDARPSKDEA